MICISVVQSKVSDQPTCALKRSTDVSKILNLKKNKRLESFGLVIKNSHEALSTGHHNILYSRPRLEFSGARKYWGVFPHIGRRYRVTNTIFLT